MKMRSLRMLTLAAAAIFAATAMGQEQRFDGQTLRVATFGGGWDKAVHELIGQEIEKRGGKVQYVLGSPRDNLAKLIASRGNPPFDVIEMDDKTYLDAMSGNLLEKIRAENVPNRKDLEADGVGEYRMAAWVVQEGILYLPEKFKQAGVPPPTRYADLAHPGLAGKVMYADLAAPGTIHILVAMAVDKGGNESNMQPAYDDLKRINPARFWKLAAEGQTQLANGDVWAATMHNGHAAQALDKGMPVAFVHPKAGDKVGILRPGWLGIVKGTKARDAAEFFVNGYLDIKAQEGMAMRRGVVPVNAKAREAIKNSTARMRETSILGAEEVKKMVRVDMSKLDPNYADQVNRAVAR